MKLSILSLQNSEIKKIDMPSQFSEPIRPDLIKRAVKVTESNKRQPYGSSPDAGMRQSAYVSKRRNKFKTTYGIGQSRTPRKVMSVRGTRFNWVGAVAPQTVGGRRAHPPKSEKIWAQKINIKERRKAIRSALSATMAKEFVAQRGHILPDNYPFIIESKIENVSKTKEAKALLEKIGMKEDLERSSVRKIRAGKGKMRGRKYRKRIGPLIIVSNKECSAIKAFSNIPGIDIESVEMLNIKHLAPGSVPGRLALFSEKAIERITNEKMFTEDVKLVKIPMKKEEKKPEQQAVKKVEEKKEVKAVKPEQKTIQNKPDAPKPVIASEKKAALPIKQEKTAAKPAVIPDKTPQIKIS